MRLVAPPCDRQVHGTLLSGRCSAFPTLDRTAKHLVNCTLWLHFVGLFDFG